jgi:hypothetical protein
MTRLEQCPLSACVHGEFTCFEVHVFRGARELFESVEVERRKQRHCSYLIGCQHRGFERQAEGQMMKP